MDFSERDGTLLSPESICPDQGYYAGHTVTAHSKWDPDLVKSQAIILGRGGSLQAKELCDKNPLHGNDHGSADICEKCSFESCIEVYRLGVSLLSSYYKAAIVDAMLLTYPSGRDYSFEARS
jgi:hypothetical protein